MQALSIIWYVHVCLTDTSSTSGVFNVCLSPYIAIRVDEDALLEYNIGVGLKQEFLLL